ncbi:MAG: hypothetical protein ACX939_15120 [Hyphococcus sp.]
MKSQLKTIAMTAAGVLVAGFLMYSFRNAPGLKEARLGFDGRAA